LGEIGALVGSRREGARSAVGAGHVGSCAEYLRETVARLEELGIRDRNLWRLQALVAERITAAVTPSGDSA
jgi:cation transport protein ChaC